MKLTDPIAATSVARCRFIFLQTFLILILVLPGTLHGQLPNRSFNSRNSGNPYGLLDLDHFSVGNYGYCKWGNLMDGPKTPSPFAPAVLSFTPLTDQTGDLFLNLGLTSLSNFDISSGALNANARTVSLSYDPALPQRSEFYLFRKLHFENTLVNIATSTLDGSRIDQDTTRVIVLIHGYNPDSAENGYVGNEFSQLQNSLNAKLKESDWKLILYHWEKDADTGPLLSGREASFGRINASAAAEIAHQHGQHLGELLATKCPNLLKVHFIAHSAGAWAARAATRYLLQNTGVKVQVTFLDPFIPGELPNNTSLKAGVITDMPSMDPTGSGQLVLLENYYAIDISDLFGLENATSIKFGWNTTIGVQQRIDWGDSGIPKVARWYGAHEGPIEFYADTVNSADGLRASAGLENPGFNLNHIGWKRSMFWQEGNSAPKAPVGLFSTAISSSHISLSWLDNSDNEAGVQIERKTGFSGWRQIDSVSANVTTYSNTGLSVGSTYYYRIRAYNSVGNSDYSNEANATTLPGGNTVASYAITPSHGPGGSISPSAPFTVDVGANRTLTALPEPNNVVDTWSVNGVVKPAVGTTFTLSNIQSPQVVRVTFKPSGTGVSFGSLVVNLSPPGAVSAGGQWKVDGGPYRSSGDTVTSLAPGPHTLSFKTVVGFDPPADRPVVIVADGIQTETGSYTPIVAQSYALQINSSGIGGQVVQTPAQANYSRGSVVRLAAYAADGYHFVEWSGLPNGSNNPYDLVMDGNRTVTPVFAKGSLTRGDFTLTIVPQEAIPAGAKWKFDRTGGFLDSGTTLVNQIYGPHYVEFSDAPGWVTPEPMLPTVVAGQGNSLEVRYKPDSTPGTLIVNFAPAEAVAAGAKWHINAGQPRNSGESVSLPGGTSYTVSFDPAPGWLAPSPQTVLIKARETMFVLGKYGALPGSPVIFGLSPHIGALEGGTVVTLDGANFTAPINVMVSGKPALEVTQINGSLLTFRTPASAAYGSAPVMVQTPAGNATNLNGFAYGFSRGTNLTLAGSIGGAVQAVAVQGNDAFLGQGASFVVLSLAIPTSPLFVGRVALPGIVRDIELAGDFAYVADDDAGLQVVDVSKRSEPRLVGYYQTPGTARGLALLGARAYLADGTGGLQVLDVTNPARPTLAGSIPTDGEANDVAVTVGAAGIFAYITTQASKMQVVDASSPANLKVRGVLTLPNNGHGIVVSGSRGYVGCEGSGLVIADITNPENPVQIGAFKSIHAHSVNSLVLSGARIFTAGIGGIDVIDANNPSSQLGSYDDTRSFTQLAIANGNAYLATSSGGMLIIGLSDLSRLAVNGQYDADTSSPTTLGIGDTKLYVGDSSRLRVLDISNPIVPSLIYDYPTGPRRIVPASNRLYFLGDTSEINILDASSRSLLGKTASKTLLVSDFYLAGNSILAIGSDSSSLPSIGTFDAANPASPVFKNSLAFVGLEIGDPRLISGNDRLACAAVPAPPYNESTSSLAVINVTNPSNVQQIGPLTRMGPVQSILLSQDGRYLYVGGKLADQSLKIFDLIDNASPVLVGSNSVGGAVFAMTTAGNSLFLGAGKSVLVYDLTQPGQPKPVRSYKTPGLAWDVKVSGNTVYVADGTGGLVILKLIDIEPPKLFITGPTFLPETTAVAVELNLDGSANDIQGAIAKVTWSNSRGGGGDASGTGNWVVNGVTLQPGTNVITVTAFDQAGNAGSDMLTVVYQAPKQDQNIFFQPPVDRSFGDMPFPLVAAASSGLPVKFSVISGPGVVTADTMLTLTGVGIVTVQADQPGNDSFNPATPKTVAFTVVKADQGISFAPLPDQSVKAAFTLSGTASSGLPVSFDIVSGSATIDNNKVTLNGAGIVTVSARQGGNANYNAAAAVQRSFTVLKLPQTIILDPLSDQTVGDAPFPLAATSSSGLPVDFAVSGPGILNGNILSIAGAGTVTLQASQSGDGTYNSAPSVTRSFVVKSAGEAISIRFSKIERQNNVIIIQWNAQIGVLKAVL